MKTMDNNVDMRRNLFEMALIMNDNVSAITGPVSEKAFSSIDDQEIASIDDEQEYEPVEAPKVLKNEFKINKAKSEDSSPKTQRVTSSFSSLHFDYNLGKSPIKNKIESTENLYTKDVRSKSVDFLERNDVKYIESSNLSTESENLDSTKCESEEKVLDSEPAETQNSTENLEEVQEQSSRPSALTRRKTFKKSKKIVRTDSELVKEGIFSSSVHNTGSYELTHVPNQLESLSETKSSEALDILSGNMSSGSVFQDDRTLIDLEKLESEYKEHLKSSLQREYKSDGDSLDEIGKPRIEWKNQSIDFKFLENDKVIDRPPIPEPVRSTGKKIRTDSESRTKSEGDKDTLYTKSDSTDTQSTDNDQKNSKPESPVGQAKMERQQSLFEKRFGKLKKMNKLLKVKRFSTSALYDRKKLAEDNKNKAKENQPRAVLTQMSEFKASKTSLASPKSLRGKNFLLKNRKFSFFGKSQSNNDININLKSIASKFSLISKSNFDLSKNSSNLRLNAVGIYSRYATSNEHRSDIIKKHGCTSPLSEAFYNATGSYQLTATELFEKFCSQDFTGLYKHEPISELDNKTLIETQAYLGAIKKSERLLKQNSEQKFSNGNYHHDQFFDKSQVLEEDENESLENNSEEDVPYPEALTSRRASSYERQLEYDQNYVYEDDEQLYYANENAEYYENPDDDIDEIYLMPEKARYSKGYPRNSQELLENVDELMETSSESNIALSTEEEACDCRSLPVLCENCRDLESNESHDDEEGRENDLKTIILEYVRNASLNIERSQSLDLLSNSSGTLKTSSNSEYAFDTVKQISFDSASKLSLSLNSDIFDDITLAAPIERMKSVELCKMEDFTITPEGSASISEGKVMREQDKIENELQSQYTIIDCDELEHDGESGMESMQRMNDEKSSFAEVLNKEFDKLFSLARNDSDTDITITPSAATVLTAIKMPSRSSMEKLEALPFEFGVDTVIGGIVELPEKISKKDLSHSMTSSTIHPSIRKGKDDSGQKSKRSHSVGAITKKKSNKCTPL